IVGDGVSFSTGRFDRRDQVIFTGAIIQNATQTESAMDFLTQRAVAIRRPTFRAPAASRAEYDVPFNGKSSQELQDKPFLNRRHRESDRRHAAASACAPLKLSILIGDVSVGATDAIGVEAV